VSAPGSITTARDAPTPKIFHHDGDDSAQRKTLSAHSVVFRRSLRGKNSTFTNYIYTGQYSYMDDPTTAGVTEGFGVLFYVSRFYDPGLGRFVKTARRLKRI